MNRQTVGRWILHTLVIAITLGSLVAQSMVPAPPRRQPTLAAPTMSPATLLRPTLMTVNLSETDTSAGNGAASANSVDLAKAAVSSTSEGAAAKDNNDYPTGQTVPNPYGVTGRIVGVNSMLAEGSPATFDLYGKEIHVGTIAGENQLWTTEPASDYTTIFSFSYMNARSVVVARNFDGCQFNLVGPPSAYETYWIQKIWWDSSDFFPEWTSDGQPHVRALYLTTNPTCALKSPAN